MTLLHNFWVWFLLQVDTSSKFIWNLLYNRLWFNYFGCRFILLWRYWRFRSSITKIYKINLKVHNVKKTKLYSPCIINTLQHKLPSRVVKKIDFNFLQSHPLNLFRYSAKQSWKSLNEKKKKIIKGSSRLLKFKTDSVIPKW